MYFSVEDHGIEEWYQPKSASKKLKKEADNTDEPKAMFKEADSHESDDSDDNNLSSDDDFWTEGIHLACKIGPLSTRQRNASKWPLTCGLIVMPSKLCFSGGPFVVPSIWHFVGRQIMEPSKWQFVGRQWLHPNGVSLAD